MSSDVKENQKPFGCNITWPLLSLLITTTASPKTRLRLSALHTISLKKSENKKKDVLNNSLYSSKSFFPEREEAILSVWFLLLLPFNIFVARPEFSEFYSCCKVSKNLWKPRENKKKSEREGGEHSVLLSSSLWK